MTPPVLERSVQLEHDDKAVWPEAVEYVSAGQSVQSPPELAPAAAEYLPAPQSTHELAIARAEYLPSTQA